MPIHLPDYDDDALEAFSVCARVEVDEGSLPESQTTFESRIDGANAYWMRTMIDPQDEPRGIHFHMDSLRESCWEPDEIPEHSAPVEQTASNFDAYLGRVVLAKIQARFSITVARVTRRDWIFSFLHVATEDHSPIRLTGVRFSLQSSQIDEVEWRLVDRDGQEFLVAEFSGSTTLKLHPAFLNEALAPMQEMFHLFTNTSDDSRFVVCR